MQERLIELLENLFPEQPDTEQAATQILQLFRDEVEKIKDEIAVRILRKQFNVENMNELEKYIKKDTGLPNDGWYVILQGARDLAQTIIDDILKKLDFNPKDQRNILIRNILILLLVFFISFILGMSFCYHFKLVDLDKIGWGVFISTRF